MEYPDEVLSAVNVSTTDLTIHSIQKLLLMVQYESKYDINNEYWDKAGQMLWHHLKDCSLKIDEQMICSVCFYSVIQLSSKQDYYLDKVLEVVGQKLKCANNTSNHISDQFKELLVVSLIYGIFQSSFFVQRNSNYNESKIGEILKEMFNVILLNGYEYSQYTIIAFRTIKSFEKVCEGPFQKYIFNQENLLKLFALVNNNWENPVTGIRNLNRSIFQIIISMIDKGTYEKVIREINGFYWNKAKFLMLAEIVENFDKDLIYIITESNSYYQHSEWIQGLIYSLHKPGLVSAGTDLYNAMLKKISNLDQWCEYFLDSIKNILNGGNPKAVENFSNYWCTTTMKKFETITNILLNELEKLQDSKQILYSQLCIIKQANKLGIINKNWSESADNKSIENRVFSGIIHSNTQIRILAFDIVCVTQGKSIPSQIEYDLILDYLQNNVNSDSTVLRINMLTSLNNFLTKLHSTFVNVLLKNESSEDMKSLVDFSKRIQKFIANNLNVDGNYQRKITSVKLFSTLLNSFTTSTTKKKRIYKRETDITLIEYLKKENHWMLSTEDIINKLISLLKDHSDDIRENVINILINYYRNELKNVTIITRLIDDAKKCMESKYFFDIGSGQSIFKLVTNLLIMEKNTISNHYIVEDIFDFAYDELITQSKAKTNVLNSIESGKQLNPFINILIIVLEECNSKFNYYELDIQNKMNKLINVLENVSNQFAWEEEGSSDFSKIDEMVHNIIISSDYNNAGDNQTRKSGLQQLVLNCLWLNVKASCDLASILLKYNNRNVSMCEKCLYIITHVLETCRHKGAIEAAGVALGKGIQYLTSMRPSEIDYTNDVRKVPAKLLRGKLNDLISETNKMSSVTRRGAGLSIMVHRIVSSDMDKGKPLFHYFMKTILETCNETQECSLTKLPNVDEDDLQVICKDMDNNDDNIGNRVDLRKAIYIHLLTRIVTDSSLATDTIYYSVELAELAFGNLASPHWQIRNAALQLYGALIPRIIGQKKASGTDEETIATVACDEMRTHLPQLWKYITEQLKQKCDKDLIQTHSNLIPILNLLANCAKRYNFSIYPKEDTYQDLFPNLILLLNSPIYTVRRLTARAIFNMYDLEFICEGILKQENITENLLHGLLLVTKLCYNCYCLNSNFNNFFNSLEQKFHSLLSTGSHSYLCKKLFEHIFVHDIELSDVKNTLKEINGNINPGVSNWAEARLKKYIDKSSWNDIPNLLNILLKQHYYEKYCKAILLKIDNSKESSIPSDVLLKVARLLLAFKNRYSSCIIWQILYEISLKINLFDCIDIEDLLTIFEKQFSYKLRYMVPLIAKNIGQASIENKSRIVKIINTLSDFENSDVDMRYIAALANNELAFEFNKLSDSLKVIIVKCVVMLLQDEDEDVRDLSGKFYMIFKTEGEMLHSYICLNKILNKNFLEFIFDSPQTSIPQLMSQLINLCHSNHSIDEYNPFSNDSKNIYFEPNILKLILNNITV